MAHTRRHFNTAELCVTSAVAVCLTLTCMPCSGVGYKSDFMTYCTNKLYGLMFARELATRLKASYPHPSPSPARAHPIIPSQNPCSKCCPHHMAAVFVWRWHTSCKLCPVHMCNGDQPQSIALLVVLWRRYSEGDCVFCPVLCQAKHKNAGGCLEHGHCYLF